MTNNMLALNMEESSAPPRKRARRDPSVPRLPSPQPDIEPPKGRHHEFDYIGGLSNRERVDLVLARLSDEYRWSIKDLIHDMVTEEPEKKYGRSTKKRYLMIKRSLMLYLVLPSISEITR